MRRHGFFRFIALVLALALGWGTVVQGGRAGQMTDSMTVAAGIDMQLEINCECCGSETDVSRDLCQAVCGCYLALFQIDPVHAAIETVTPGTPYRAPIADHPVSPDPHPPKHLLSS